MVFLEWCTFLGVRVSLAEDRNHLQSEERSSDPEYEMIYSRFQPPQVFDHQRSFVVGRGRRK